MLWLLGFVLLTTLAASSQETSSTTEMPDLNLILQRLGGLLHRDPAQSLPYEVTREYKVFHGYSKQSTSEVIPQIDFVPPDVKTYKIIQARGNSVGEKMVREILATETDSTTKNAVARSVEQTMISSFSSDRTSALFLRMFWGIFPKRKEKKLRGQIWVDASTFRIRRTEGVPFKTPSFWLKEIHITLQFAKLGDMWVPVTFDGIATSLPQFFRSSYERLRWRPT